MINLNNYINICEAIDEDNLYYKLDKWFNNNDKLKSDIINIISHYRNNKVNKEPLEFMVNNIDSKKRNTGLKNKLYDISK